jgi:hypothetical protein
MEGNEKMSKIKLIDGIAITTSSNPIEAFFEDEGDYEISCTAYEKKKKLGFIQSKRKISNTDTVTIHVNPTQQQTTTTKPDFKINILSPSGQVESGKPFKIKAKIDIITQPVTINNCAFAIANEQDGKIIDYINKIKQNNLEYTAEQIITLPQGTKEGKIKLFCRVDTNIGIKQESIIFRVINPITNNQAQQQSTANQSRTQTSQPKLRINSPHRQYPPIQYTVGSTIPLDAEVISNDKIEIEIFEWFVIKEGNSRSTFISHKKATIDNKTGNYRTIENATINETGKYDVLCYANLKQGKQIQDITQIEVIENTTTLTITPINNQPITNKNTTNLQAVTNNLTTLNKGLHYEWIITNISSKEPPIRIIDKSQSKTTRITKALPAGSYQVKCIAYDKANKPLAISQPYNLKIESGVSIRILSIKDIIQVNEEILLEVKIDSGEDQVEEIGWNIKNTQQKEIRGNKKEFSQLNVKGNELGRYEYICTAYKKGEEIPLATASKIITVTPEMPSNENVKIKIIKPWSREENRTRNVNEEFEIEVVATKGKDLIQEFRWYKSDDSPKDIIDLNKRFGKSIQIGQTGKFNINLAGKYFIICDAERDKKVIARDFIPIEILNEVNLTSGEQALIITKPVGSHKEDTLITNEEEITLNLECIKRNNQIESVVWFLAEGKYEEGKKLEFKAIAKGEKTTAKIKVSEKDNYTIFAIGYDGRDSRAKRIATDYILVTIKRVKDIIQNKLQEIIKTTSSETSDLYEIKHDIENGKKDSNKDWNLNNLEEIAKKEEQIKQMLTEFEDEVKKSELNKEKINNILKLLSTLKRNNQWLRFEYWIRKIKEYYQKEDDKNLKETIQTLINATIENGWPKGLLEKRFKLLNESIREQLR